MMNILIHNKNYDPAEDGLIHGIDFAEDEMTICGTYTSNSECETKETKASITCPRCKRGLAYYRKMKVKE